MESHITNKGGLGESGQMMFRSLLHEQEIK